MSCSPFLLAAPVKRGRGRPKGSKNKKTLEKERLQALANSRRTPPAETAVAQPPTKPASAGPSQPTPDKGRKSRKVHILAHATRIRHMQYLYSHLQRPISDEEPSPDADAADEDIDAVANDESSKKPSSRPHKKAKIASSGASSGALTNGDSKSPETVDAIPTPTSPPAVTPKKRPGRPSRKPKTDEAT